MTKLRFYSKEEVRRLREIKSLPTRKERKTALAQFGNQFNRTPQAVACKMNTLKKLGSKVELDKITTMSKREVRISFDSPWVDWKAKQLVFPLRG